MRVIIDWDAEVWMANPVSPIGAGDERTSYGDRNRSRLSA